MMDRLLTAGLCGNTIGQDIQTLTYHSSTSNMAFHLKDIRDGSRLSNIRIFYLILEYRLGCAIIF